MKIAKVDRDRCEACGNCEAICPEVFQVDETSRIITEDFRDLEACIEAAIENCPEDAITFEEEQEE